MLAFTAGIALATVLLFGAGPAWAAARSSVNAALNKGAGRGGTARGNRLRNTLVVTEIALTVVLLAAAGLLLRSYVAVLQTDPGFNPQEHARRVHGAAALKTRTTRGGRRSTPAFSRK